MAVHVHRTTRIKEAHTKSLLSVKRGKKEEKETFGAYLEEFADDVDGWLPLAAIIALKMVDETICVVLIRCALQYRPWGKGRWWFGPLCDGAGFHGC